MDLTNKFINILQLHAPSPIRGGRNIATPFLIDMDFLPEILRNILASLVSTITIVLMFLRYINKTQISHAYQISTIIKDTANAVFDNSQLEYRVKQLEQSEKEKAVKMDEQFAKVNERLDQIYSIMAHK